jgi:uncharacterized protein (DUF924 family)
LDTVKEILDFWFGTGAGNLQVINEKSGLWWKKSTQTDAEIRQRFETALQRLVNGELDAWRNEAYSQLAMIILADQFSRNMYRETAEAFATDPLAIAMALNGIDEKKDVQLRLVERVFFYMPLQHTESIKLQDRAVLLFDRLVEAAAQEEKKAFQLNLDFAIRHRDIIHRFGRFVHRNQILGRKSTAEEIDFLMQPGSSF